MARKEFAKKTKREAYARSNGRCEAEGDAYGHDAGVRCNAILARSGVHYDHVDPDANSKDNSLENCCACCPRCHDWKTSHRDRPLIAKTNHQADMARGIEKKPGGRKLRRPAGMKYNWQTRRYEPVAA